MRGRPRRLPPSIHRPRGPLVEIVNVKSLGGVRAARKAGVVYCGRGSPLGNPFRVSKDGTLRHVRCPDRKEELLAELRGLAWAWFVRLVRRGKDVLAFVSALATFAARAVNSGRRVCG